MDKRHFKIKNGILNSFSQFFCANFSEGESILVVVLTPFARLRSTTWVDWHLIWNSQRPTSFWKRDMWPSTKRRFKLHYKRGNFLEHFYFNVLLINILRGIDITRKRKVVRHICILVVEFEKIVIAPKNWIAVIWNISKSIIFLEQCWFLDKKCHK